MVKFGVLEDRAILVVSDRVIDVETRSNGNFSCNPMDILMNWQAFDQWARTVEAESSDPVVSLQSLGCPVPAPNAIYGIGLNYRDHAEEASLELPKQPMVFAKFPTCITHANSHITLTSNRVDWEAELVVVIGSRAHQISEETAMSHVAGFTIGQDISDRRQQFSDRPPQFCLGKSAPGYGPIGPIIVSPDGFADSSNIALSCHIDDEEVQSSRTGNLIFTIPQLIAFLSKWCVLEPGDLIFTGTPSGVGAVRDPRRYLQPGEVIRTTIEGIGTMRNTCV